MTFPTELWISETQTVGLNLVPGRFNPETTEWLTCLGPDLADQRRPAIYLNADNPLPLQVQGLVEQLVYIAFLAVKRKDLSEDDELITALGRYLTRVFLNNRLRFDFEREDE